MALTPEQEKLLAKFPPHMREDERRRMEIMKEAEDEDDPPVWEFDTQYRPDPNRGMYEPMQTRTSQYKKVPLSKAILQFYELDRNELKRFQELAYQAGYYVSTAEREDIPFGSYDEDTFKAWTTIAKRAANMGRAGRMQTIWDVLQDDVNNRPESLGKKRKRDRGPLVTELPDPRHIEETIRAIAPEVIGRDADDAFTQDFIAMYSRIVANYQENKYALEGTEEGGSITAPPSASSLASFRLRTENPEAYEQHRAAQRSQEYTALLKSAL